jgi:hypothetical protein
MTFTLQQKKEAFEKLSDKDKGFIMDNDTTERIGELLSKSGMNSGLLDFADSEILNAMYGLQTLDGAIDNISIAANINSEDLLLLKSKLNDYIFSNLQVKTKNIDLIQAKKRLAEIVNKYGLTTSQATVLENEVMSVIDRNLGEKITTQDLTDLLNISNLLAEQIVYELEARVFERGVKAPEKPRMVAQETLSKPEPTVSFGNTTLNVPKEMMKPAFENTALDAQKQNTSIGVPRYATEDIYKPTQPASNPIVNNKLNIVTPGIRPIETKYQKDPYREPLE